MSFLSPPRAMQAVPTTDLYDSACLQALPFSVGTLLPIAATAFALLMGDRQLITTTCLAPYLLTLFCQIWMEGAFIRRGVKELPCVCPDEHCAYDKTWRSNNQHSCRCKCETAR